MDRWIVGALGAMLFACAPEHPAPKDFDHAAHEERMRALIAQRARQLEDSTLWDSAQVRDELANFDRHMAPFTYGVFPVPDYDLIGRETHKGQGSFGGYVPLGRRWLVHHGYYVNRDSLNAPYLDPYGLKDEVFFQILVASDTIDTVNYAMERRAIISRNHPNRFAQGRVITRNSIIDYAAFLTADRNNYAIVNTRLFDLRLGRTILIAPQPDGSSRSMQVTSRSLDQAGANALADSLASDGRMQHWLKQGADRSDPDRSSSLR